MIEPDHLRKFPILALFLRWRLEIAGLCMVTGSIVPLLPEAAFWGVLGLGFLTVVVVGLYAMNGDGDRSALASRRPILETTLYMLCWGGLIVTGYIRWANDDYLNLDGFPLFVVALVLLAAAKGA